MNAFTAFLETDWTVRMGLTLVHSLWQVALIAAVYAIAAFLLRNRSADSRYLLGCFAIFAMLGLPMATYALLSQDSTRASRMRTSHMPAVTNGVDEATALPGSVAESDRTTTDSLPPIASSEPAASEIMPAAAASTPAESDSTEMSSPLHLWLPWATAAWLMGVLLLSLRPLWGWMHVRRLQRHELSPLSDVLERAGERSTRRLGVKRIVRFAESALVEVPTVVGCLRPLVLLPASAVTGLSAAEIELILVHELAHVRRHDCLVNLAQTVIEALLFYHPGMWWVSSQIRKERENCCDDMAVAIGRDRTAYVHALARLEQQRAPAPVVGLAATGGALLTRVRRLLGRPTNEFGYRYATAWLAGLASISLVAAALAMTDAQPAESETPSRNVAGAEDVTPAPPLPTEPRPENESLDDHVRRAFRFMETEASPHGGSLVSSGPVQVLIDFMEFDAWTPQIGTGSDREEEFALHMPLWELTEPVPVDLCFTVEFKVLESGEVFAGESIVIPKGKKTNGYFSPQDAHRFGKKYIGFVPLTIMLKSFRPKEPEYSKLTKIWQGTLVSEALRAKSYQFKASEAPAVVRELRSMLSKLAGIDANTATSTEVYKAMQAKGVKEQTSYHIYSMTSLNPYRRKTGASVSWSDSLEGIPFLVKLLEDTDSLPINPPARTAVRSLMKIGQPAVPALIRTLKHEDPAIRVQVVRMLNHMATNERRGEMKPLVLPHLIPLLSDDHGPLREAAAHTLHRFVDSKAVAPLIAALSDESPKVRAKAALALGWNRDARAIPELAKTLSDPVDDVRAEAATALGKISSPECLEPLVRALKQDAFSRVRCQAAWGLAYLKDDRANPVLLAALKDDAHDVVGAAAYGLGELKSESAIVPLIEIMERGRNARRSAARALKKITGEDFGEDAAKWTAWHERENKVARPVDNNARRQFVAIERIARLSMPDQAKQLPHLYKDLAPHYMNQVIEGILSWHPENILDRTESGGPGGDHRTTWTQQLADAALEMSPEQVADKLEIRLWLDIAARKRAIQVFKKHANATAALIDADLKSGGEQAVNRACDTILTLQLRSFVDRLLTIYMDDADPPEGVFRTLLFMRNISITRPLLERVEKDPKFIIRCAGLFQGPLWRRPAEPALFKLLESPDREVRYYAAYALYECRDPKLAPYAVRLSGEKETRFRRAAAHVASNLPEGSFADVRDKLLHLLNDKDETVRFEALRCFAEQKDPAAGPGILKLLKQDKLAEGHRITVLQAMSKLAGSTFNYRLHDWGPGTSANKQAIEKFEAWLRSK